jgi:hypothetical protein
MEASQQYRATLLRRLQLDKIKGLYNLNLYYLKQHYFILLLSTIATKIVTLEASQKYRATLSGRFQHDKIKG